LSCFKWLLASSSNGFVRPKCNTTMFSGTKYPRFCWLYRQVVQCGGTRVQNTTICTVLYSPVTVTALTTYMRSFCM
jgi:hypothetical protein